ncbi:hypothetical protein JCM15908A_00670 [Prevotella dentasini JCM 15908]
MSEKGGFGRCTTLGPTEKGHGGTRKGNFRESFAYGRLTAAAARVSVRDKARGCVRYVTYIYERERERERERESNKLFGTAK